MRGTQRLFLALWPPSDVGRQLHRLSENLLRHGERSIPPQNIHLTLTFLGSVSATFRECAEQAAAAIRIEPFTLALEQMGCWPKSGTLWTSPRNFPVPLLRLVQALNKELAACGYAPEQWPFACNRGAQCPLSCGFAEDRTLGMGSAGVPPGAIPHAG